MTLILNCLTVRGMKLISRAVSHYKDKVSCCQEIYLEGRTSKTPTPHGMFEYPLEETEENDGESEGSPQ